MVEFYNFYPDWQIDIFPLRSLLPTFTTDGKIIPDLRKVNLAGVCDSHIDQVMLVLGLCAVSLQCQHYGTVNCYLTLLTQYNCIKN